VTEDYKIEKRFKTSANATEDPKSGRLNGIVITQDKRCNSETQSSWQKGDNAQAPREDVD
jgi:hypothetical protein